MGPRSPKTNIPTKMGPRSPKKVIPTKMGRPRVAHTPFSPEHRGGGTTITIPTNPSRDLAGSPDFLPWAAAAAAASAASSFSSSWPFLADDHVAADGKVEGPRTRRSCAWCRQCWASLRELSRKQAISKIQLTFLMHMVRPSLMHVYIIPPAPGGWVV